MTNREQYQNAMGKIAPSEAWKADTLQKMAALREESAPKRPRLQVHRRVLVPLAAVSLFAVVLVPHILPGVGLSMGEAAEAPARLESAWEGGTALPPEEKAQDDGAALYDMEPQTRAYCPVQGGEQVRLAPSPEALQGGNPTANLPAAQLPAELPVWRLPTGPEGSQQLQERLNEAARQLQLEFVPDEAPPAVEEATAQVAGSMTDPATGRTLWQAEATGNTLTLVRPDAPAAQQSAAGQEQALEADEAALARFGPLAGLAAPAYESTALPEQHFYYEHDPAQPMARQLQDYCFKRVTGSLGPDGQLQSAVLTLPPSSAPEVSAPLASPEEAARLLWNALPAQQLDAMPEAAWRLEYSQSEGWLYPVYVFTVQLPQTPEEAGYTAAPGQQVYLEYQVSAVVPAGAGQLS